MVLGATGFLGRHVVDALLRDGWAVSVVDRLGTTRTDPRVTVLGARGGPEALRDAVARAACSTVVDCAWSGVAGPMREDQATQSTNVDRVRMLVAAARDAGVVHWLGLGSQAEYGVLDGCVPEGTPLQPTTAYGHAKVQAHRAVREGLSPAATVTWLRVFACYGPHQDPGWLLPDSLRLMLHDQPLTLRHPRRGCDYLYAGDLGSAVADALRVRADGVFNVGFGSPISLQDLIELARTLCGSHSDLTAEEPQAPDATWFADTTALRLATTWRPRTNLTEGLSATIRSLRDPGG